LLLQSEVAQLRNANDELAGQNEQLKAELSSLEFEASRLARIASDLKAENSRMHTEMVQLSQEFSEVNEENSAQKSVISDLKRKNAELEMAHSKIAQSIADPNGDLSVYGLGGSDPRRELAEVKIQNASLAQKLLRLKVKKTELKNQYTQVSTQVAALTAETARMRADASALTFDKDRLRSEKTRLKTELVESRNANSQSVTDLENAREALRGQKREIDRLKQYESVFHQSAEILEESSIPPSKFPEALRNRLRQQQESTLTSAPSVSEVSIEHPPSRARRIEPLDGLNWPQLPPKPRRVPAPQVILPDQLQADISLDRIIQMHNQLWKQENEQTSVFFHKRVPRSLRR
jgi:chromosome segregation ATPase